MFDGDISNDSYSPERLRDQRLLAFMQKITVKADPAFVALHGNVPPTRITVTLEDGRRISRQVDGMPGFAGQPISRADVERKFRSNVGKRWSRERTDATLRELWSLDQTDDLGRLLGTLVVEIAR
jgi:2-methylcitrate dehydratase